MHSYSGNVTKYLGQENMKEIEDFYRQCIQKATVANGQLSGCCPFHEDKHPSFSANLETGQCKCHAEGCGFEGNVNTFAQKLGVDMPETLKRELRILRGIDWSEQARGEIVAEYPYTDERGNVLFYAIRYETKEFKLARPDGNGGLIYDIKDTRRVLYKLPQVLNAQEVFIVEGEKDVDKLTDAGFTATTNPMGAGKWREEYNEALKGKDVIIIPDNDEAGRTHANQVEESLRGVARSIKCVKLPEEVGEGGDVSDYFDKLKKLPDDLSSLIQEAKYTYKKIETFISLSEFMKQGSEEVEWLLKGIIPKSGITILAAKPKVGKTLLTFNLALCVASGRPYLGRETRQGAVILIQMEDPQDLMKQRFKVMGYGEECPICICQKMLNLNKNFNELMDKIEKYRPVLVIFDPLIYLTNIKDENSAVDVANAFKPLRKIALEKETAVLVVHHHRKGENNSEEAMRGSSAIMGAVDQAINLFREKQEPVARVHILGRYGKYEEFMIQLNEETLWWEQAGDIQSWKQEKRKVQVKDYLKEVGEARLDEIAKDLGESESTIRRIVKNMGDEVQIEEKSSGDRGRPLKLYRIKDFSPDHVLKN